MSKRKVLDAEGKEIDAATNLEAFLQGIPQSELDEVGSAPSWENVTFEVDDPDLKGKSGKDVPALFDQVRAKAKQEEERAANLERQLAQERQKSETEAITRRVIQEQQAKPPEPEIPAEDPRQAKIDELWFTDPPEARRLLREMNDESAEAKADAKAKEVEAKIMRALDDKEKRKNAFNSFGAAHNHLLAEGLELDQLKAAAVLQLVGNPAYPYFNNGGLYKAENLIHAAHTLFGRPAAPAQAVTQAQAAPPVVSQPAAPIVVPPGSSKPAPAAAPARKPAQDIDPRMKRDYEHMAENHGLDPAKLLARRAARLQREGDH